MVCEETILAMIVNEIDCKSLKWHGHFDKLPTVFFCFAVESIVLFCITSIWMKLSSQHINNYEEWDLQQLLKFGAPSDQKC